MKTFRYQIQVAGYTSNEDLALNFMELGDRWLQIIGTVPELCMVDTQTGKWLTDVEIAKVTGLDGNLINEICRLRMKINGLYGQAMQSRIYPGEE